MRIRNIVIIILVILITDGLFAEKVKLIEKRSITGIKLNNLEKHEYRIMIEQIFNDINGNNAMLFNNNEILFSEGRGKIIRKRIIIPEIIENFEGREIYKKEKLYISQEGKNYAINSEDGLGNDNAIIYDSNNNELFKLTNDQLYIGAIFISEINNKTLVNYGSFDSGIYEMRTYNNKGVLLSKYRKEAFILRPINITQDFKYIMMENYTNGKFEWIILDNDCNVKFSINGSNESERPIMSPRGQYILQYFQGQKKIKCFNLDGKLLWEKAYENIYSFREIFTMDDKYFLISLYKSNKRYINCIKLDNGEIKELLNVENKGLISYGISSCGNYFVLIERNNDKEHMINLYRLKDEELKIVDSFKFNTNNKILAGTRVIFDNDEKYISVYDKEYNIYVFKIERE